MSVVSYRLLADTVGSEVYPPPPLFSITDAIGYVEKEVKENAFARVQTAFELAFAEKNEYFELPIVVFLTAELR